MAFGTEQSGSEETDTAIPSYHSGTKKRLRDRKYSCSFCSSSFRRKDALDRHTFHHTNIKKYSCSFEGCPKAFTNVSHLRRHMRAHDQESLPKLVRCLEPSCSSRFTTTDNMRKHFKSHHERVSTFTCKECQVVFRRKKQLRAHLSTHTGQFPYHCEVCERGFTSKLTVRRHRQGHEHKCEVCGREFRNWTGLVAHRKIAHESKNEHECPTCGRRIRSRAWLKQHMKMHGLSCEVFECQHEGCGKFYLAKRNLTTHVRSKHEGKRFICDLCGRELVSKAKVLHHLKLHLLERDGGVKRAPLRVQQRQRRDAGVPQLPKALQLAGLFGVSGVVQRQLVRGNIEIVVPDVEPASSEAESIF